MNRHTKCRTHVQLEARRLLLEVERAQRCLAKCLERVDQVKATEAEVQKIRQQSTLVAHMIEVFNAAKSDAELAAAMQLVVRLTALEDVPSIRLPS
jgi:ATP-dependent 26S proteasome regulatory subunit